MRYKVLPICLFTILIFISCGSIGAQGIITTIVGNGTIGYNGDGEMATAAELNIPTNINLDNNGNLYIADQGNNRIRKVNTSDVISTIAGTGIQGYDGDGGAATAAEIGNPVGIALDRHGNIYIAQGFGDIIRKIDTTGIISTFAGTSVAGYSGDGGAATAAELNGVFDVAVDVLGNIYVSDIDNYRIRKIDTMGIISTVAGNGTAGFSGDEGPATNAEIHISRGMAIDNNGNLYIADAENNRIRKVNTSGIISTVVGNGIAGYSGDGGNALSAEISLPLGLFIDGNDNLYIGDAANHRIRKVDASGTISTIAGNGILGYSGDGGPATNAELNGGLRVVVDNNGNVIILDGGNQRIRKISVGNTGVTETNTGLQPVKIYPNPTNGIFTVEAPANSTISICDIYGKDVAEKEITDKSGKASFDLSSFARGIYFVKTASEGQTLTEKIVLY